MESFASILIFLHDDSYIRIESSGSASVFCGIAVVSFILSFILLFFGKRLLRLSLGITGFIYSGSIPFWICMINYYTYISPSTVLIIMLVVGAFAAFILSYFTKFGIYIIGAASGVQFSYLLWAIISYYSYSYNMVLFIVIAVLFGLVGLILPYFFMSYMMIIITIFNGFLFFRCAIQYLLLAVSANYNSGRNWGILFGSLIVGCLGTTWQYHKYKNYPELNKESNKTSDEKV